jgi:excisionase family DNA binding protein
VSSERAGRRIGRSNGAAPVELPVELGQTLRDARTALGTDAAARVTARLALDVPADVLEAVARRAAELLAEDLRAQPEPWIGVEEAAAHLACPRSRIYRLVSRRSIPFEKDGQRLLFRRSTLDEWVARGGATA